MFDLKLEHSRAQNFHWFCSIFTCATSTYALLVAASKRLCSWRFNFEMGLWKLFRVWVVIESYFLGLDSLWFWTRRTVFQSFQKIISECKVYEALFNITYAAARTVVTWKLWWGWGGSHLCARLMKAKPFCALHTTSSVSVVDFAYFRCASENLMDSSRYSRSYVRLLFTSSIRIKLDLTENPDRHIIGLSFH